jgi:hypothetical protein
MSLRPVLPPGADVVRRDARTLVVGTRPGVPVPDRPGLVPLLRLLDGRGVPALVELAARHAPDLGDDVEDVVRELVARGALADGPPPPPASLTVRVQAWGGSRRVADVVSSAIADLDLGSEPLADVDLLVLASAGEPDRAWVAGAVETGVPVLPVVLGHTWARVGPLTLAGRTPCLGCHDAQRAEGDPAWAVVVPQLGRPVVPAPPPRPVTPLLHRCAAVVAEWVERYACDGRADVPPGVVHLEGSRLRHEDLAVHPGCTSLLHRDD